MGPGGAGNPHTTTADRVGDIQGMCNTISELRERAQGVEGVAQELAKQIVGPDPAEDDAPDLAQVSESCMVSTVNSDAAAIRASLAQTSRALERIVMELGSVGK